MLTTPASRYREWEGWIFPPKLHIHCECLKLYTRWVRAKPGDYADALWLRAHTPPSDRPWSMHATQAPFTRPSPCSSRSWARQPARPARMTPPYTVQSISTRPGYLGTKRRFSWKGFHAFLEMEIVLELTCEHADGISRSPELHAPEDHHELGCGVWQNRLALLEEVRCADAHFRTHELDAR